MFEGHQNGRSRPHSAYSHLPAGAFAPAGIYVVSHLDPIHTLPHEILVLTPRLLPSCNHCAGVRFSLKSACPQTVDDNENFALEGDLIVTHAWELVAELRELMAKSRERIAHSRQFLERAVKP